MKQHHTKCCSSTYCTVCCHCTCLSPSSIQSHVFFSLVSVMELLTLVQYGRCISIQCNLELMGTHSIAAQKWHMLVGTLNFLVAHAPDWKTSTLNKPGQLASKDPFLLLEIFCYLNLLVLLPEFTT